MQCIISFADRIAHDVSEYFRYSQLPPKYYDTEIVPPSTNPTGKSKDINQAAQEIR